MFDIAKPKHFQFWAFPLGNSGTIRNPRSIRIWIQIGRERRNLHFRPRTDIKESAKNPQ